MKIKLDHIYNMDCLEGMKHIPDGSVDAVICDLPYGTTACAWDSVIPFEPLWEQYRRVCKPNAAVVLFGSEPFSSALRMSAINLFKYDWIWHKDKPTGFQHAKNMPLKDYEIISVFSKGSMGHVTLLGERRMPYNPQGIIAIHKQIKNAKTKFGGTVGARPSHKESYVAEAENYPRMTLDFNCDYEHFHPTQKPVDLIRYLVLTYTNSGGGSSGQLHRQRHDSRSLYQGETAFHRLRVEQRVFRHRPASHQERAGATDIILTSRNNNYGKEKTLFQE